jgi:hypothetical protein
VLYKDDMFWTLLFFFGVLCVTVGALVTVNRRRAALFVFVLAIALTVEAVNSYLGVMINDANEAMSRAGYDNVLHRTTPTTPFHVAFGLLVLIALLVPVVHFHLPKSSKSLQFGGRPLD